MKKIFFLFLLSLVLIAGCKGQDSGTQTTGAVPTGEVKEFTMTAKNWEFEPSTIRVNQGDQVKITVTSVDVTHGFAIPAFGVSERLTPGKSEVVEFFVDKKGTFGFACSVFCGAGHNLMEGQLIVE